MIGLTRNFRQMFAQPKPKDGQQLSWLYLPEDEPLQNAFMAIEALNINQSAAS
ncbi:hypothetical protein [Burkholderia sp. JP2-270]|uniref:hypothetical protein n=1 Tax=Burkholderia sp. JP2-270 TaxID=2217913 RepID=UPI0013A6FDBB|nr:hypothetical protein [Burkholderia sp. JP2-270]